MPKFTVIGYDDYDRKTVEFHEEAKDEYSAVEQAARGSGYDPHFNIVAVVPGHVEVTSPCEDSGSISCACDYRDAAEEFGREQEAMEW